MEIDCLFVLPTTTYHVIGYMYICLCICGHIICMLNVAGLNYVFITLTFEM